MPEDDSSQPQLSDEGERAEGAEVAPSAGGLAEVDFGGPVDDVPAVERPTAFDPEPTREKVRAIVAVWLVALLSLVAVGALAAVLAGAKLSNVRAITELVLPPIVALCGSAIGFYFAGRGPGG